MRGALLAGVALAALVSQAAAQSRQPAQITTLPTTTPQGFEALDKTGTWLPLAAVSGGVGTDVRQFGCKADGTDQTACINVALTNAPDCVLIPATQNGFTVAGTITVSKCLRGTVFNPTGTTSTYDLSGSSRILCNNQAAQPCLVVNRALAGTSGQSTQIENISLVGTNAGNVSATPVAGSKGFQWTQGNNLILTNFQSSNFDSCAYFGPSTASPGTGPLSVKATNTFLSRCQKHYVVVDGVPELYFIGGRWGSAGDYASADDFLFATKTTNSGAGGGPNTIVLDAMQLNTAAVGCAFRWGGFVGTGGAFGANRITNTHMEINDAGYTGGATQGIFCVDSSLPYVPGMRATNNFLQINSGATSHPAFNIAPTVPWKDNVVFVNNNMNGAPFTLTISGLIGSFTPTFIGNYMQSGNTFVAGDTSAQLSMIGNFYSSAVFNGKWNNLNLVGNFGGVFDNATGSVLVSNGYNLGAVNAWTPAFSLSGGSVAYTTQSGTWFRNPDGGLTAYFVIALNAISSPTGNLTIAGMPKSCLHPSANVLQAMGGFTGLTGLPFASWVNGSANINLLQTTATGQVNLTGANLTATTTFVGTVTCGIAQ
jgi:hypothetical protein